MTMYKFFLKDTNYQAVYAATRGKHVATIEKDGYEYHLYAIGTFFLEVVGYPKNRTILKTNLFSSGIFLDKYLPFL